jgi:hypothetical protein
VVARLEDEDKYIRRAAVRRSVGRYDQFHDTNVQFWDHRPQILGHLPYFCH